MMKFTQITEQLNYPKDIKATLSTLHSGIITYAMNHFQNTKKYKSHVISVMNTISYYIISGDTLPSEWSLDSPLTGIKIEDSLLLRSFLGKMLIQDKEIEWDIEEPETVNVEAVSTPDISHIISAEKSKCQEPTPKEDLYLKAPMVPLFDVTKPWLNVTKDNQAYTIYASLPLIPVTQRQISITTDVNAMTDADLMKLYPNHLIRTRSAAMYESYDDIVMDPKLGVIFPIDGFTTDEIRENIIQYPHFYKLVRLIDDKPTSFYSNIEVDGELYDTLSVWSSLPDSKKLPRTSEFIKEYVVRRYLLERDLHHVTHRYPMFGKLEPFLTLFTTPEDYIQFRYTDTVELARKCVTSRVGYLQSRNPILKKVYQT